jgi:hypothetical protein
VLTVSVDVEALGSGLAKMYSLRKTIYCCAFCEKQSFNFSPVWEHEPFCENNPNKLKVSVGGSTQSEPSNLQKAKIGIGDFVPLTKISDINHATTH